MLDIPCHKCYIPCQYERSIISMEVKAGYDKQLNKPPTQHHNFRSLDNTYTKELFKYVIKQD